MTGKKANKKAISDNLMFTLLNMALLVFVVIAVAILTNRYMIKNMDVSETHANIFIHRMMTSPNTFAYTENLTRNVQVGIIDHSRFNQDYMDKVVNDTINYGFANRVLAAKITLTYKGKKEEVYYNKDYFDIAAPWGIIGVLSEATGRAAVDYVTKRIPVTVREETSGGPKYYSGYLDFAVVMPGE